MQLLAAEESALNRALRQQSALGNAEKVAELLKHGADPNTADQNGRTALSKAVVNRDAKVVPLLLAARAKPDPSAVRVAGRFNRTEALKLLLAVGGDPDAALAGAAAGHYRLVRRLLVQGADAKSKEGSTALLGTAGSFMG